MYTVPVCNTAVNQQQAEITKITHEPLSATPNLQETLAKMTSRMTLSQMQANLHVPNLQHFENPNLSSTPAVPSVAETIPNSDFSSSSRVTP